MPAYRGASFSFFIGRTFGLAGFAGVDEAARVQARSWTNGNSASNAFRTGITAA